MAISFSSRAAYLSHGIVAIAIFALILGVIFQSQFSFAVQAQELVKTAAVDTNTADAPATSPSEIFLELAATVGQTAPARRLVDYKLQFDPSSQPRYWAVVDFNQPSTSKRPYVFDKVGKKVNTYYVAH